MIKNNGKTVFESDKLIIVENKISNSYKKIITFSSEFYKTTSEVIGGFGECIFEKNGISAIHVIPKADDWWSDSQLMLTIRKLTTLDRTEDQSELWTLGIGEACAAAVHATKCFNIYGAICISPNSENTFLEPYFSSTLKNGSGVAPVTGSINQPLTATKLNVIYDPGHSTKSRVFDKILKSADTCQIPITFSGGATERMLEECNLISELITKLLTEEFDSKTFKLLLRSRRTRSIIALTQASEILLRKNKLASATRLSSHALQELKSRFEAKSFVNTTVINKAVLQSLKTLAESENWGTLINVAEIWSPYLNISSEISPYILKAATRSNRSTLTFSTLMSMWSCNSDTFTEELYSDTALAIEECLTEAQIAAFNRQHGPKIKRSRHADAYTTILKKHLELTFVDESRNIAFGTDGYLYLSGGHHAVLDYITGRRSPSLESYDNFMENITNRSSYCASSKIRYLHIIFPDKQSVQRAQFPLKEITCLGELYLKQCPSIANLILYPTEVLQLSAQPFLKKDTHMSSSGYITLTVALLKELGIEKEIYETAERELNAVLTKESGYAGDLGSKITPPDIDTKIDIDPDWRYYHTKNSVGVSNDGLSELYFNENALTQFRVVIFGDSFFRMHSLILSKIFKEVAFFRTRFFHEEIISMAKPDIVLSGNAERYLSQVDKDEIGPNFFLYPHLKGLDQSANQEFAIAMNAFLSYGKTAYADFISTVNAERPKS